MPDIRYQRYQRPERTLSEGTSTGRGSQPVAASVESTRKSSQRRLEALIFFGPAGFLLFALVIFPTFYNLYLSFRGSSAEGLAANFPTLANYVRMGGDARLLNAILVNGIFLVSAVVVQLFLGATAALAIDSALRDKASWIRSLYFLPMMIPAVVVGAMWRLLYDPTSGFVNYFVRMAGLPPQQWLGSPVTALPSVLAVDTWQWTPFIILITLAALSIVPQEQLEAAQIDGANALQSFIHVKFPYILPALAVGVLFRIIELIKLFDIVLLLTQGGPGASTETASLYIFLNAFRYNQPEYAAAMALVLLIIASVLAQVYFRLLRRGEGELI